MPRPTLFAHRKLLRLARAVGGKPAAIGHLELLWNASYGSGTPVIGDADDVEAVAEWVGEPGFLVTALLTAGGTGEDDHGFVDRVDGNGKFEIHDFWDHAPDYVAKRRDRELARCQAGKTLSDVRREAAGTRWDGSKPGAKVGKADANDNSVAAVCMQPESKRGASGGSPSPSPSPSPSQEKKTVCVPGKPATDSPDPVQALLSPADPQEDRKDEIAKWAIKAKGRPKSVTPRHLEAVVVRCLREIRQAQVIPEKCATAAAQVIGLWSAVGHPDVDEFADELVLVARAAQMSRELLFARDIRAENWPEGVDRTHNVDTICRRDKWDSRLQAAKRWAEASGRIGAGGVAYAKRQRWMEAWKHGSWMPVEGDEPQTLHRAYLRCAKTLFEQELAAVPLDMAVEKLVRLAGLPGASGDLTAIVRLALDETGMW
jgi:hypothetical protein